MNTEKKTVVITNYDGDSYVVRIDKSQDRLLQWLLKKKLLDGEVNNMKEVEEI